MTDIDTRERYIETVLSELPRAMPGRDQIAAELRTHIEERLNAGMPLDEVLSLLGDPRTLAESYVSAVSLVPSPLGRRLLAKVIDGFLFIAAFAILILLQRSSSALGAVFFVVIVFLGAVCSFYFVVAEYAWGTTIGKRLLDLYVVRESGTRIGLGQSFVRQFPLFFGFLFIDAIFIPFTERRQRAFELVSSTRVVHQGASAHGAIAQVAQTLRPGASI